MTDFTIHASLLDKDVVRHTIHDEARIKDVVLQHAIDYATDKVGAIQAVLSFDPPAHLPFSVVISGQTIVYQQDESVTRPMPSLTFDDSKMRTMSLAKDVLFILVCLLGVVGVICNAAMRHDAWSITLAIVYSCCMLGVIGLKTYPIHQTGVDDV